jgi:hypothetical protein
MFSNLLVMPTPSSNSSATKPDLKTTVVCTHNLNREGLTVRRPVD